MKKLVFMIMASALICSFSFARTPPAEVENAFKSKFPKATKVKWEKEDSKKWEAKFELEGSKICANYAENGTWLKTKYEIAVADLPGTVSIAVESKYPD
jgi:hypothetical protein